MEIWDLYDLNGNLAGQHVRGNEMPEEFYHLVIHVWLKNKDGKFLMTQRSPNKATFPLKWECVGGSVIAGEDSLTAAVRETEEEVGIVLNKESGKLLFTKVRGTIAGKRYNDIVNVWLFEYSNPVSLSDATTDEVCQVKWMDLEEIAGLQASNELVTSIKDLSYLFDPETKHLFE